MRSSVKRAWRVQIEIEIEIEIEVDAKPEDGD
jgi:hypothetical protein